MVSMLGFLRFVYLFDFWVILVDKTSKGGSCAQMMKTLTFCVGVQWLTLPKAPS